MQFQFKIEFLNAEEACEIADIRSQPGDEVVYAFVNDRYAGRVYLDTNKSGKTIMKFRNNRNPWSNRIRIRWSLENKTIFEAVRDQGILDQLLPVILRNACVNCGVLFHQLKANNQANADLDANEFVTVGP